MLPTHLDPLFPDNLDDPISLCHENVRALPAPAGTILFGTSMLFIGEVVVQNMLNNHA